MFSPDSHLFETNLSLLAQLSDEELADPELVAQITTGGGALALGLSWLGGALKRGLAALADWMAQPADLSVDSAHYWMYPPIV